VLAACGGDAAPALSPAYQRFRDQPTACGAEQPEPARALSFAAPDELGLSGSLTATIHTSCGDITIELRPDLAPVTVNSFVFLAEQGYFDGTVSHRILSGFVVQLGDPTATGTGSPGYRIPDELPGTGFVYETGVVAMANGGPDTGGSQFFIALDRIGLDPNFTVFGFVTAGADTLDRIAAIPVAVNSSTGEPSLPLQTLYVESVSIDR
ncbi:MAG TPA: peptidylprolyl isomerase, partial [Acidimicrobiia bacterium]|nr:peptidylprolyl isomerase [Acidimicrobiia bacterium]